MMIDGIICGLVLFIFGFVFGSLFIDYYKDRKNEETRFKVYDLNKEIVKLQSEYNKLERKNKELKCDKDTLLGLLDDFGYSEKIFYDPYLKTYKVCWGKVKE